jgi:hypothetical protein
MAVADNARRESRFPDDSSPMGPLAMGPVSAQPQSRRTVLFHERLLWGMGRHCYRWKCRRRWRECRSVDSIPRPSAVPRRPATVGISRRREPTTGIAAAAGRLDKIFRPQNRRAVIQTLPATSSSEDGPDHCGFPMGSDRQQVRHYLQAIRYFRPNAVPQGWQVGGRGSR